MARIRLKGSPIVSIEAESTPSEHVSFILQEEIKIIEEKGYGEIIQAIMDGEVYTKKGKINKSALCRKCNISLKDYHHAIEEIQSILKHYK